MWCVCVVVVREGFFFYILSTWVAMNKCDGFKLWGSWRGLMDIDRLCLKTLAGRRAGRATDTERGWGKKYSGAVCGGWERD